MLGTVKFDSVTYYVPWYGDGKFTNTQVKVKGSSRLIGLSHLSSAENKPDKA